MHHTLTFILLLACVLVILLATCSCTRPLRSCAAYIVVLGPSVLALQCPPAGFQQQGEDTTEAPR